MSHSAVSTSTRREPRGGALFTGAFAVLFIAVGAIAVSASTAAPEDLPVDPLTVEVSADRSVVAESTPPEEAAETPLTPHIAPDADADTDSDSANAGGQGSVLD